MFKNHFVICVRDQQNTKVSVPSCADRFFSFKVVRHGYCDNYLCTIGLVSASLFYTEVSIYKLNRCQKTSLLVIKTDVILGIRPIAGSIRTRTIKTNLLLIHP